MGNDILCLAKAASHLSQNSDQVWLCLCFVPLSLALFLTLSLARTINFCIAAGRHNLYEYFASKFAYHNCELCWPILLHCVYMQLSPLLTLSLSLFRYTCCLLYAAFNQLVDWRWRLSACLFSLLSLAFYLRATPPQPLFPFSVSFTQWLSEPDSIQSSLGDGARGGLHRRRLDELSRQLLSVDVGFVCPAARLMSRLTQLSQHVEASGIHPLGFVLHSKWIIIELSCCCRCRNNPALTCSRTLRVDYNHILVDWKYLRSDFG